MRRFLEPAALVTLLVLALLPAASLACQWVCAAAAADQAHHASHHHAAPPTRTPMPDNGTRVVSSERGCDHVSAVTATLCSNKVIGAPVPAPLRHAAIALVEASVGVTLPPPSPPASPPGLISLRV